MTLAAGQPCRLIAVGGSAGALPIVIDLIGALPADFPIPILLCLHLHPDDQGQLAEHLSTHTTMRVVEACDKMPIEPGRIHVAPANYHLLVERSKTLALSIDPKVHFCRPAIDLLFDSAARAYPKAVLAILLSGANQDGAAGLAAVGGRGGIAVVQDPASAQFPCMPQSAIEAGAATLVLTPADISQLLVRLNADPLTISGQSLC